MTQERGRQQKDKLEQISNEYSALHTIFKKLTGYEEELSLANINFAKKWKDIITNEESPDIQNGINIYADSLIETENSKKESLSYIKQHIQGALKHYPVKIKKQKRSLSRSGKSARDEEDKRIDDIEDKVKNFETMHVADMKQIMLHLINAEMFYHSKCLECLTKSYTNAVNELNYEE